MRNAFALGLALLLPLALAGCTEDLTESDFELRPTQIGWKAGQDATFVLRLVPGNHAGSYDVDPVFAITEVRFEKNGVNVFGDYETKRAQDLAVGLLRNGTPIDNATLTPASPTVEIKIHVPEQLENGEYRLELKLFRVGWIESDLFRVAI